MFRETEGLKSACTVLHVRIVVIGILLLCILVGRNALAQSEENSMSDNSYVKRQASPKTGTTEETVGQFALSVQPPVFSVDSNSISGSSSSASAFPAVEAVKVNETRKPAVQWKGLLKGSLNYLGAMHAFRLFTEQGTRDGLHNSIVGGYFNALGSMHGWSDGDGYYENYLGHPIEGAVSGYIWIRNDPRYRNVQFGMERDYWVSRLRAYAFAWAFSEQFEIGPISEASIGQIQRYCCAYGFVDHVITPNGGLVWMLGGDALDRYVTVPIERRTRSKYLRILARSALNPPQTFANVMMLEKPWRRENRDPGRDLDGLMNLQSSQSLLRAVNPHQQKGGFAGVPKFEITGAIPSFYRMGKLGCLGGEGVGGFRVNDAWQWTAAVGGCTLGNSVPTHWSGDSLTFATGPQWILHSTGRWSPHVHFRIGGQKITEEQEDPIKKQQIVTAGEQLSDHRDAYVKHWESTGLSLSVGGGLDVAVNRGLAVRIANLEYTRSWLGKMNGADFDHGVRFSTGLVLRIGTW